MHFQSTVSCPLLPPVIFQIQGAVGLSDRIMKLVLLTALVARCGALVLPARPVATMGRVLLRSRPIVLEVAPESAAEPQANGLPEGWATATDDEGSTYYWNKVRREPMQARTLQLTHVSCRTPAAGLSHTHLRLRLSRRKPRRPLGRSLARRRRRTRLATCTTTSPSRTMAPTSPLP